MKIKLDLIHDNPNRLRDVVQDESFDELVESLHERGLLQPIKVRPNDSGYEIIYGHRRTAAMRYLGWRECEAIVESLDDEEVLLQSIAENLQRKNMTVFEEAQIYKSLHERGFTVTQIAEMVSKSQGYITTRMSLLRLPPEVQNLIQTGKNQQVATTELGGITIDSASRISSASATPEDAVEITRKVIDEQLTGVEVRKLTARFKQARDIVERQTVLDTPFRQSGSEGNAPDIIPTHSKEQPSSSKSTTFHTAHRSVSDQFHSKWIWNLRRINLSDFDHFTIGYSQRTWEQVAEILQLAAVTILVDARRNAVSQYKPDFSKTRLKAAADSIGVTYLHIPDLGIDSADRVDLSDTHNYDKLFQQYEVRVDASLLNNLLEDKLRDQRLAFLCVELDPETCHRHVIALLLENMGFPTLDL